MAQKAHLPSKFTLLILYFLILGCSQTIPKKVKNIFEKVDTSQIPNITISQKDSLLQLNNGIYYFNDKPFSGYINSKYNSDTLKSIASYLQGKQHGVTKTFFSNGKLESERNYKDGIGYGRHFGYWKNGKMKFDFIYFNDKREGVQKQWYESGSQYCELSFINDQENGMQKAWRENGKPYINYEVKDGIRYGLQKSALCYTLKNEKLK
jgi:antitoxin component YwqK of YwqJK toxin-antitoxin module